MDFPIVGVCADIPKLNDGNTDFIIGIGNNAVRKRIAETYDVRWVTLIHPSAQIAVNVSIGKGTAVMAGAVINACATVGAHCIINTHTVVEHDNVLEDYVHISPNAALGGAVRIGERSWIGLGTAVINNIDICKNCIVGAGAVVVNNITETGTYVSIPVRKIK
jgi:sugar O-acyltransferase (sialic acid O-acetyltransferase NeuD family)